MTPLNIRQEIDKQFDTLDKILYYYRLKPEELLLIARTSPRELKTAHEYNKTLDKMKPKLEALTNKLVVEARVEGWNSRNELKEGTIEECERLARIDELEKLPTSWSKIKITDADAYHLLKQCVQDRIKQLKEG